MLQKEADVSSEKKIIGQAQFVHYETVDEALNDPEHGLGEEGLLDILNSQVKTNAMNVFRTSKTKGPTKGALRTEAASQIVMEITRDGEHQEVVGNSVALEALINRRMVQLETEAKASLPADAVEDDDE